MHGFYKLSIQQIIFRIFNHIFLILLAFFCLFPVINILAISFSSSGPASAGMVTLLPIGFTTSAYEYILRLPSILSSFIMSLKRVVIGTSINMLLTVITAYPLSKKTNVLPRRTLYIWFFFLTTLFSGGIIPLYLVVSKVGLLDNILSLILPGAVPVFNVIIMSNFFRTIPHELEEAALIDGAGHMKILFKIFLPLSPAVLATLSLFSIVGHWNAWFDGMIFMSRMENYPLQTFLQTSVVQQSYNVMNKMNIDEIKRMAEISEKTVKAALIFIGAFPVLCVYPFLQKYFVSGVVLGSVKE